MGGCAVSKKSTGTVMTYGGAAVERPGKTKHLPKPEWLKTPLGGQSQFFRVRSNLTERQLVTVCEEAKCPNIGSCWSTGTATFMVLGDTCTRACRFCHVKTGNPGGWLDSSEPDRVADSVHAMKLRYVVLTMVDRDDLADGGAGHVAEVISRVKEVNPGILVEVLAGDFAGDTVGVQKVLDEKVAVYAHNLETVKRLSPRVRDGRADYLISLNILSSVKQQATYPVMTKSALMLGLGEEKAEVLETLHDLRAVGCELVTLGQYMRPTKKHLSVKRWVPPQEFEEFAAEAREMGFRGVAAHPLVRSSYKAHTLYEIAQNT